MCDGGAILQKIVDADVIQAESPRSKTRFRYYRLDSIWARVLFEAKRASHAEQQ